MRQVLGEHPDVHALLCEARFVVDPGGFEDLVRALTTSYTPYHADDALRRLAWLLTERLTGQTAEAFRGWGLAEELGAERYRLAVDRLWERLVWYDFDEVVPPASYRWGGSGYAPGEVHNHRRTVGRYYSQRAELIGVLRDFIKQLFGEAARRAGKRTWCEKTPYNLLSIPFLWELFPEARVVVVVRDPRLVVASHQDQQWAPSKLDEVLSWLEPIYRRWLAQRPRLLNDARYVEVRVEALADNWEMRRPQIFERLGLPDADTPSGFSSKRLRRRDGQLLQADRDLVASRLGWAVEELGYEPWIPH
jgi:omega-hydroxy-beta-dihydromenaquinone-9 sulfotransferase